MDQVSLFPFPTARALLSLQSFVAVRADVLLSAERGDAGRRCVQALRQACGEGRTTADDRDG